MTDTNQTAAPQDAGGAQIAEMVTADQVNAATTWCHANGWADLPMEMRSLVLKAFYAGADIRVGQLVDALAAAREEALVAEGHLAACLNDLISKDAPLFGKLIAVERDLAAAREEARKLNKMLSDLTIGGSEFADDPQRCFEYAQEWISKGVRYGVALAIAERERDAATARAAIDEAHRAVLQHVYEAAWDLHNCEGPNEWEALGTALAAHHLFVVENDAALAASAAADDR